MLLFIYAPSLCLSLSLLSLSLSHLSLSTPSTLCSLYLFLESTPHLLHWQNVQQRMLTVQAEPAVSESITTLLTAESDAYIQLTSSGLLASSVASASASASASNSNAAVANTLMTTFLSSCINGADVRVSLTNGGTQTVRFGSHGTLEGFECSVRVTGAPASENAEQIDTLRIESNQDARALEWTISEGFECVCASVWVEVEWA